MSKAVIVISIDAPDDDNELFAISDQIRDKVLYELETDASCWTGVRDVAREVLSVFDPTFKNAFHDAADRKELLGQLAGAASLCWGTPEGSGVFQSEEAAKYVDDALERLDEIEMESHNADTLAKVHEALTGIGYNNQGINELIQLLHNKGILFRERT